MNNEAIEKIANTYGFSKQSRQLIEEMAELTVAINKYHRECDKPSLSPKEWRNIQRCISNITEEMADVEICISILKHLLCIKDTDINEIIEQKLNRQLERINNGLE